MHRWSIEQPEEFWSAVWDFCEVIGEKGSVVLRDGDRMPGAQWFPEARLNFAENLLTRRDDSEAIVSWDENGKQTRLTRDELFQATARCAAGLRAAGIVKGDRVAAYLPNIPQTVIVMLAAASIGAVFSSCSPDFGVQGVVDRFGQIEPKILFVTDGYWYNGKPVAILEKCAEVASRLTSVEKVVVVPFLDPAPEIEAIHKRTMLARVSRTNSIGRDPGIRASAFQSSALHLVFLGHDWRAEVVSAQCGRHALATPEGTSTSLRP